MMSKMEKVEEYDLYLELDEKEFKDISNSKLLRIRTPIEEDEEYCIQIDSIEEAPLKGFKIAKSNIVKLIQALKVPFLNNASFRQAIKTFLLYLYLSPSRISVFFIRGWRLQIIRNMITSTHREIGLSPSINRISLIGDYIKEGVLLIAAKVIYDLPKVFIITAIGYHYIEFILDWITFIFGNFFGQTGVSFNEMVDDTKFKVTLTLSIQLLFIVLYSIVITPVYKINEIKYALNTISYQDFFKIEEIKDSFKKYRSYRVTTLQVYSWDLCVSITSFIFGSLFLILMPWLYLILIPFYKLFFKHWPKAYGYGLLARKMDANNDL